MKKSLFAIFSLLAATSGTVSAQWSAGVIGIGQTNPYIGGETGVNVFPIVAYEGEKLVWRGPFLDYYVIGKNRGNQTLSLNLFMSTNDFDPDGDPRLVGIQERDNSFMLGATYRVDVATGKLSLALSTDISDEHDGQVATLGWSKTLANDKRFSWAVNGGIEVEYLSDNYANYYYGVSAAEQQVSAFTAYDVGSVVQPKITLGGYYSINKQWRVVANAGYQILDSAVKDSPIVDGNSIFNAFVGVVYNF